MLELYSNSKGYGVKNLTLYVLDLVCLTSLIKGTRTLAKYKVLKTTYIYPVDKIAERAACRSVFLTMALYFESRMHSFRLFFLAIFPTGY